MDRVLLPRSVRSRPEGLIGSEWVWFFGSSQLRGPVDIPTHHDNGSLVSWPAGWDYRRISPGSVWDPSYLAATVTAWLSLPTATPALRPNVISPMQRVAVFPVLCGVSVFAAAFWNSVDVNRLSEAADHARLDWQVAIKLVIAGVCGVLGGVGVIVSAKVRRTLITPPGCLLVALASVFAVTSLFAFSEVATVSRVAALILIGYVLFVPTAVTALGLRRLAGICLCGLVLNLAVNWALYLGWPTIGVFEEELAGRTIVPRMGGLGHPNAVGRIAVLAGLVTLALARGRGFLADAPLGRWAVAGILTLVLVTVVASYSRTSMLAGLVAGTFLMLDHLLTRRGWAIVAGLGCMAVFGLIVWQLAGGDLGESVVAATTKTGDVRELTSATGRTDIWAEAVRLIAMRPWTGWGLNSSPVLMADYSAHTHNLILHVLFSGGILAGGLMVLILIWQACFGLRDGEPLVRAISAYVLISGVFEDTVLDVFAAPSTLLWLVVLVAPTLARLSKESAIDQSDRSVYT